MKSERCSRPPSRTPRSHHLDESPRGSPCGRAARARRSAYARRSGHTRRSRCRAGRSPASAARAARSTARARRPPRRGAPAGRSGRGGSRSSAIIWTPATAWVVVAIRPSFGWSASAGCGGRIPRPPAAARPPQLGGVRTPPPCQPTRHPAARLLPAAPTSSPLVAGPSPSQSVPHADFKRKGTPPPGFRRASRSLRCRAARRV